jgi:hypothetical protein
MVQDCTVKKSCENNTPLSVIFVDAWKKQHFLVSRFLPEMENVLLLLRCSYEIC